MRFLRIFAAVLQTRHRAAVQPVRLSSLTALLGDWLSGVGAPLRGDCSSAVTPRLKSRETLRSPNNTNYPVRGEKPQKRGGEFSEWEKLIQTNRGLPGGESPLGLCAILNFAKLYIVEAACLPLRPTSFSVLGIPICIGHEFEAIPRLASA